MASVATKLPVPESLGWPAAGPEFNGANVGRHVPRKRGEGNMKRVGFLLVLLILLSTACGGGSDAISPPANVAGTWAATITVAGGAQFPATFNLAQTDGSVSGSFSTNTTNGTVSGSINGQALSFTLTQSPPCAGAFSGAGTVNGAGTAIAGGYSGSDCNGTFSATVNAIRQYVPPT